MLDQTKLTTAQLRDEFAKLEDDAYLSRKILAAALQRANGWLHLQEKRGKVPPFIQVGSARLYRKKDVLAYFFKVHTPEVSQ